MAPAFRIPKKYTMKPGKFRQQAPCLPLDTNRHEPLLAHLISSSIGCSYLLQMVVHKDEGVFFGYFLALSTILRRLIIICTLRLIKKYFDGKEH
jgi:hypothetical protein